MNRKRWPKGTWMKLTSGATLRALMDQHRLSNADVANFAGVNRSFISALATGRKMSCTPRVAEQVARCLQVPLEVLFVPKRSAVGGQNSSTKQRVA